MIAGFDNPELGKGVPLGELAAERTEIAGTLHGHWGISTPQIAAECAATLLRFGHSPDTPARVFVVPGRLEVLGKHTDYGGGRSLIAAVERGFTFVSVPRADGVIGAHSLEPAERVEFRFDPDLRPLAGWANYPMTVARRLTRNFPGIDVGVDLAFRSTLPPASGMSSSSALIIGTFLCLASEAGLLDHPGLRAEVRDADDLASYLAAIESGQGFGSLTGDRGVGTHGGSEDHTAILRAREGALLQYHFVPAQLERSIPLPSGYTFAIAASGVISEKAGAMREKYNRASALVRTLLELWNDRSGAPASSLAEALRSSGDAADRLRRALQQAADLPFPREDLRARLDHFLRESEGIVPAAADALEARQMEEFGVLVDESQRLAEELLGTQIPETVALARAARALGATAASAFGAGYGGSVWALVEAGQADEFHSAWQERYSRVHAGPAARASFLLSGSGMSARRVG